jgi:uncharacterized protein (DUF1499 family)
VADGQGFAVLEATEFMQVMISMKLLFWSLPALFMMSGLCFAQSSIPPLGSDGSNLKQCPQSPNCVSSQAGDSEHAVAPLTYSDSRAEAYARLKTVLSEMTRMTIVAQKEDYIHAEARSLIFRFVDDVEFYFPAEEKVIHVRSASRVGYSDLGVNRKRVEEIRDRFAGTSGRTHR